MGKYSNASIVIGGGSTTGLGAIRSLGRAGVDVYYIDAEENISINSRYCRKYFLSPKIRHSKEELRRILSKIQQGLDSPSVIFPGSDLYILHLSDLIDELESSHVMVPRKEIVETLVNKRIFYQSLRKKEIPIPDTHFPEDLEDAKKIGKEISYPVFMKPCFSHLFAQQFTGGVKGFVAKSQQELTRYYEMSTKKGIDMMIQEIITGSRINHVFLDGYIDKNSVPKVLFARQRLRMWPLNFGNSSSCMSIPISKVASLKEPLFRYLNSINYHGIFSAEFKKGEKDNVFKLLEINSRTSGWFSTLSAKCGCSIMLTAYLDAIGNDTIYKEDYEAGIKLIFLNDDIRSSIKMFRNGDLSIREWISSLRGKKDYVPYASDDPMPFFMDLPNSIRDINKLAR
jgi:D-aspartate ligase